MLQITDSRVFNILKDLKSQGQTATKASEDDEYESDDSSRPPEESLLDKDNCKTLLVNYFSDDCDCEHSAECLRLLYEALSLQRGLEVRELHQASYARLFENISALWLNSLL